MSESFDLTRDLLALVIADLRKWDADIKLREAWVYKVGKAHWEFHYGEFYWHGSAYNAYEARANGWAAYMAKQGVEGYVDESISG